LKQQIGNTWIFLKCGAREGWRRSVGLIFSEARQYYIVKERGIHFMKQKGRLVELVTSSVGSIF
jgi:hypothetical protein